MLNPFRYLKDRRYKKLVRKFGGKIAGGPNSFSKIAVAEIEEHVELGHVRIEAKKVRIGAYTYIRSGSELSLVSSIGRFCSIGSGCVIGQEKNTHPSNWVSSHPFQYENSNLTYCPEYPTVTVGHDVWIGTDATILAGVTIGTGAIIATRALVSKDVPPYAIVGGNPAKIIRYRHTEVIISRLLKSRWWNLDIAILKSLPLNSPVDFLNTIESLSPSSPAKYKALRLSQREGIEIKQVK